MNRLICSCIAILLLCSCDRGIFENGETVPVELRFEKAFVEGRTKSSVIPMDVETKESGAVVAFYDAQTGLLVSQHRIEDLSSPKSFVLRRGRKNVYVLGNTWLIDGNGEVQEPSFPVKEEDLQSFSYEFGAVPSENGCRTESFDETGKYGIPVRGVLKDVEVEAGTVMKIALERMFAKVRITVDHGGMSRKNGAFKNEKLYFRQANFVQTPFASGGSRASAKGQLALQSDYESPMEDGEKNSFTFYIPENRQITPVSELATFVEFTAEVDKEAGGFGGGVTYRFYLGKDSGTDNDLEGNVWYDILLSFNVNSLFEPSWRVNPDDDFSDGRLFCLMKDKSCESVLGGQDVVVRSGRPGRVYVYMNRNGVKGENHLIGRPMENEYAASSLDDCAWTGDFSELSKYGISASWEASEGRLTMTVTDKARFVSGVTIPVTLRLSPGSKEVAMNVKTAEDQTLKFDTSEFYLGMMRSASLSGFAGSELSVRAESEKGSCLFRTSGDPSASFVGMSGMQFAGNAVDLYAWGCNESAPVTLVFESDDGFNDDPLSVSFKVLKPLFRKENRNLQLRLDGTATGIDYGFNDRNGKEMDEKLFSPELYEKLLAPSLNWSGGCADVYAAYESGEFYIDYFGHYAQKDWIAEVADKLGTVEIKPESSLYKEYSEYRLSVGYPRYERAFPAIFKTDYLNEYFDSELNLSADFNTFGNAVSFSGSTIPGNIPLDLSVMDSGGNVRTIALQMGEIVELTKIPGGLNVITASLVNPRVKSGDREITWDSYISIYHNLTIAPFAVFQEGSPEMTVYLTYPKAAWMIRKYYEGKTSEFPEWDIAGRMNCYERYLWSERLYTVGLSVQRKTSSSSHCISITYWDLFPSDFPNQKAFTREMAESVSSRRWLNQVLFKWEGAFLSQPLQGKYLDGNSFYRIMTSNSPIGWVYADE